MTVDDVRRGLDGLSITTPTTASIEGDSASLGTTEQSTNYSDSLAGDERIERASRTHSDGRSKNREIWYSAARDDYLFSLLMGKSSDEEAVALQSSDLAVPASNGDRERAEDEVGLDVVEVQPFRNAVSRLPFALQFILELHIFDNDIIEVQRAKKPTTNYVPAAELDSYREKIATEARALVVAFVRHVIPPLLGVDWGSYSLDVDDFALSELFAEAIRPKLCAIKQAVKDSAPVSFDEGDVREALVTAERWLAKAERRCGGTEPELASDVAAEPPLDIIKRRARWPYAEYSCRFIVGGDLVPAEYVIVNHCEASSSSRQLSTSRAATPVLGSNSRRALREGGWLVRDRFCRVTGCYDVCENLAEWIRSKPMLCGRTYEMLLDKGVGPHMQVW